MDTTVNLDDTVDNFLTRQKQEFDQQKVANETDLPTLVEEDENTKSHHLSDCKELEETKNDGIILKNDDDENQISPIPKISTIIREIRTAPKRRIIDEDTMDNVSIDSTSVSLSLKKPKLMRTGSLTKNLRKSLSFGIKTPTLFRSRRNSTDHDVSASASMISMESTFNETFTKPIKEKFRRMKEKVAKISGKNKDYDTPKKGRGERSFIIPSENANDSRMNSTLPASMLKTPEKGQFACTSFLEPKTPKFFPSLEFQIPKSSGKQHFATNEQFSNNNDADNNNMVIHLLRTNTHTTIIVN